MGNKGELLLSHYAGSQSLSFLCSITTLEIDQINFIACQFAALILSFILKRFIRNPRFRLVYCLLCGVFICNFCFGVQVLHVITSAGLSYVVIRKSQSTHMPCYVFAVSMLYLSWIHIWRQFFNLANGYSLDITGPLMVLTQKVTSIACAVNDGRQQNADKKLTELQKVHAIRELPEPLEYWSFIFQFQSLLTGPLVFFKEYHEFIYHDQSPSPSCVVLKKLGESIFFAVLYLKVAPQYDMDYLREEDFLQNTSFLYKLFYINVATSLERTKYYHAWILSDAVCNASGLGYSTETKSWDLVTNVDAIEFELGLNLKESLDKWNKGTMKWLRYVVYERFGSNVRTMATYAASAMWHGFYPGYYITFLSGALFTSSARIIRKTIRPIFMDNRCTKTFYDFVTWLTTRLTVSYVSFTFVLLDFMPSIYVYLRLYFFMHVAAISSLLIFPKMVRTITKSRPQKVVSHSNNNGVKLDERTLSPNSTLYIYSKVSYDDTDTTKLKTG